MRMSENFPKRAGLVSITSHIGSSVDVDPYAMELQPIRDLEEQYQEDGEYFSLRQMVMPIKNYIFQENFQYCNHR